MSGRICNVAFMGGIPRPAKGRGKLPGFWRRGEEKGIHPVRRTIVGALEEMPGDFETRLAGLCAQDDRDETHAVALDRSTKASSGFGSETGLQSIHSFHRSKKLVGGLGEKRAGSSRRRWQRSDTQRVGLLDEYAGNHGKIARRRFAPRISGKVETMAVPERRALATNRRGAGVHALNELLF